MGITASRSGSRVAVLLCLLAATSGRLEAQLFENLKAFGERLDAGAPDIFSPREGPKSIASGDLDGDGAFDLAVSNLDGTLTLFFNTGDGRFLDPQHLVAFPPESGARGLRQVLMGDLNSDGRTDIAVAAPFSAVAAILFINDGMRRFHRELIGETGSGARNLATGDFDGDGKLELVTAGPPFGLEHYRLDESGEFVRVSAIPELAATDGNFPKPVYSLKSFRRPGSDRDNLIVTNAESQWIWVLRPDESGVLNVDLSSIVSVETRADENVFDVEVGALTSPRAGGLPDLVTAHRNFGTVEIRRGTLSGEKLSFSAEPIQSIAVPGGPRDVEILDLNDDGWNDVVVVLRNLDRLISYENRQGTLTPTAEMPIGQSPREVAVGDFNRDGDVDLAVINRVSEDVSLLIGDPGSVGFSALDQFYLVDGEVAGLRVVDMNGDNRDDVVQLHRASGELTVRLATESGLLSPPVFYPMGSFPSAVRIIDVNGDGIADAVTANLGEKNSRGGLCVRLGRADGSLGPEVQFRLPENENGRLFALAAADFDGDSTVDIAAGFLDCRLGFFRGSGDGSFEFTREFEFVYEARDMVAADLDLDGDIDLAGASYSGDMVVVENRGDLMTGESLPRRIFSSPTEDKFGATEIEAEDLNGDGVLDLILGSGDGALVYSGGPSLLFTLTEDTAVSGSAAFPASSVAFGDFDGDGQNDFAIGCQILSCVTLLTRSDETGVFVPALTVDVPSGQHIATGDLDGDGQVDLIGSGDALWTALSSRRAEAASPRILEGNRSPIGAVTINEILASNDDFPVAPDEGRRSEWVEVFNASETAVNLAGWALVLERKNDGEIQRLGFAFPPAQLESRSHQLVFFSRAEERSEFHTGFRLPAEGAKLSLLAPDGTTADFVDYPEQETNVSYARYRDGLHSFVFNLFPSPGAENTDNGSVSPSLSLSAVGGEATGRRRGSYVAAMAGEPIRFYAKADDDIGIVSVSVLFRRIDVPSETRRIILFDDGRHADEEPQDGVFSGLLEPGLPAGASIRFLLEAVDLSDNVETLPDEDSGLVATEDTGDLFSMAVGDGLPLEISEMVASNTDGLVDEAGGTPDWVEVRNCGDQVLKLDGVFLGERFPVSDDWFWFPAGIELSPGEATVVFCDNNPDQGPLHAPFRLDKDRGQLMLGVTTNEGSPLVVDAVNYGPQTDDVAWARSGCGGSFSFRPPTPFAANVPQTVARGDADASGKLDLADAIASLNYLFRSGTIACAEAVDVNADGRTNVTDPIFLLLHLFASGDAPIGDVACR